MLSSKIVNHVYIMDINYILEKRKYNKYQVIEHILSNDLLINKSKLYNIVTIPCKK